jgi:hypothetical protein
LFRRGAEVLERGNGDTGLPLQVANLGNGLKRRLVPRRKEPETRRDDQSQES